MSENEAPTYPNQRAFDLVKEELARGGALTFEQIGEVFGPDFWIMVVYSLMDAQDAARAIQGAINRLSVREVKKGKKAN